MMSLHSKAFPMGWHPLRKQLSVCYEGYAISRKVTLLTFQPVHAHKIKSHRQGLDAEVPALGDNQPINPSMFWLECNGTLV